jgi:enoyl-CoA hydratase/carnithine racemase
MSEVLHEFDAGVAIVSLNRPESMNALSRPVMDQLLELFAKLACDESVGAMS